MLRDIKQARQETLAPCCVGFSLGLSKKLPSRFSLEDMRAASVCTSPSSLTWSFIGFDGLVPEGHGRRRRAFVEVLVGLVGGVVT